MNEFRMIHEDGRLYILVEIGKDVYVKEVTNYFKEYNPLYEWLEAESRKWQKMKIEELIDILQQFDGKLEVAIDYGGSIEEIDAIYELNGLVVIG